MGRRRKWLLSILLLLAIVHCATGPASVEEGIHQLGRYSVAYQGPELER